MKICFATEVTYPNYVNRIKLSSLNDFLNKKLYDFDISYYISTNLPNEFIEYNSNDFIKIGFNGLTTNLNHRALNGSGTSVSSGNDGSSIYGTMNAATSTTSIFGNAEFYISNYAGNTFKNVNADTVMETNATFSVVYLAAGLWS
jgi:hypothetical protein